jgi:hypothetical protein
MSTEQATVAEAMSWLRNKGVTKLVIEFSGGNDEGGTDGYTAVDAAGNEVALPSSNASPDRVFNPTTRRFEGEGWTVYQWSDGKDTIRPATPDEISVAMVWAALEAPIYDRYYSFAGEFYVHGTLTWDVASGQHKMEGQESHEVWEDI